MASKFTFTGSKTVADVSTVTATASYFLCNSVEVKKKYLYYRRGPLGTEESACGTESFKVRLDDIQSYEATGDQCPSGAEIYRIDF